MIGKHKFKVGQRVKPSKEGKGAFLFTKAYDNVRGTIIKVDRFNEPTVLWDHRKTPSSYHPDFVEPARITKTDEDNG